MAIHHMLSGGGGTCYAPNVGLASGDIRLMADWASDNYLRYLDVALNRRVLNILRFMDAIEVAPH